MKLIIPFENPYSSKALKCPTSERIWQELWEKPQKVKKFSCCTAITAIAAGKQHYLVLGMIHCHLVAYRLCLDNRKNHRVIARGCQPCQTWPARIIYSACNRKITTRAGQSLSYSTFSTNTTIPRIFLLVFWHWNEERPLDRILLLNCFTFNLF